MQYSLSSGLVPACRTHGKTSAMNIQKHLLWRRLHSRITYPYPLKPCFETYQSNLSLLVSSVLSSSTSAPFHEYEAAQMEMRRFRKKTHVPQSHSSSQTRTSQAEARTPERASSHLQL